jgi:hypothetical protein
VFVGLDPGLSRATKPGTPSDVPQTGPLTRFSQPTTPGPVTPAAVAAAEESSREKRASALGRGRILDGMNAAFVNCRAQRGAGQAPWGGV